MTNIPLGPVLVVLVGPSGAGKSVFASQFAPEEVVSTDALRQEYLSDSRRIDQDDVIFNEFDRRIRARLELGLRVVADATHIRDTTRRRTVKLAASYGAQVIYVVINRSIMAKMNSAGWREHVNVEGKNIILKHEETFQANEASILSGDGRLVHKVIDTRKEVPNIVMPLARQHWKLIEQAGLADIYDRGYRGILAVGDVHGNVEGLRKMMNLAREEKLFQVYLGDLVDYDPSTLQAASLVARVVFNGEGAAVLGNHEKKILKWLMKERPTWEQPGRTVGLFDNETGFTGKLSPGNHVTVNQIKAMLPEDRMRWETEFLGLCALMPHHIRLGQWVFVHAAAGKKIFDMTDFRFVPESAEESFALYGETTGKVVNGFPERIYDWVDDIPARINVVVGHDCRSEEEPLVQMGEAGGRAIFLDTGSSKPERFAQGHLSAMSLLITSRRKMGFILENERFYSERDF